MDALYQHVLLGAAGAVLAVLLDLYQARKRGRRINFWFVFVLIAISSLGTGAYFFWIDTNPVLVITPVQYGLFLALIFDEIHWLTNQNSKSNSKGHFHHENTKIKAPSAELQQRTALALITTKIPAGLLLSGYLPVFAVGSFGALIAAVTKIRNGRKPIAKFAIGDWIFWAFVIFTSGAFTILHGVNQVNALTVLQLGATGPLLHRSR